MLVKNIVQTSKILRHSIFGLQKTHYVRTLCSSVLQTKITDSKSASSPRESVTFLKSRTEYNVARWYSSSLSDYEITCERFCKEVERGDDLYVVDIREPSEVEMLGRIGNAKLIPLSELEQALRMSDEGFEKKFGFEKPPEDGDDVIFYCQAGVRSLRATIIARNLGYEQSKSLAGGFNAWMECQNKE